MFTTKSYSIYDILVIYDSHFLFHVCTSTIRKKGHNSVVELSYALHSKDISSVLGHFQLKVLRWKVLGRTFA